LINYFSFHLYFSCIVHDDIIRPSETLLSGEGHFLNSVDLQCEKEGLKFTLSACLSNPGYRIFFGLTIPTILEEEHEIKRFLFMEFPPLLPPLNELLIFLRSKYYI